MAVTLANRAYMTTATVGTGTVVLGPPPAGYQSFADAGISDGTRVRYVIEDGYSWEIGSGIYSTAGPSLTRTPSESSSGGAAISLTGNSVVYVTPSAADLQDRGLVLLQKSSQSSTRLFIYDFPSDMPYRRFRFSVTQLGSSSVYPLYIVLRYNGDDLPGATYETQYSISNTTTSTTSYTNGRVSTGFVDLAPSTYYVNSLDLDLYIPSNPLKFSMHGAGIGPLLFGSSTVYAMNIWAKCSTFTTSPFPSVTGFEFSTNSSTSISINYELYAYTGSDHE